MQSFQLFFTGNDGNGGDERYPFDNRLHNIGRIRHSARQNDPVHFSADYCRQRTDGFGQLIGKRLQQQGRLFIAVFPISRTLRMSLVRR